VAGGAPRGKSEARASPAAVTPKSSVAMNEVVLDTHALVWWLARPERLGRRALKTLKAVDRGRTTAFVPSIVGVELSLLVEAGRLRLGVPELQAALDRSAHLRLLAHDLTQALEFALLRSLDDPFDRMIVAAARATQRPLVTADARLAESGLVEVLWD
jgi:PIN domain nuclease of toxin-antitoxin system